MFRRAGANSSPGPSRDREGTHGAGGGLAVQNEPQGGHGKHAESCFRGETDFGRDSKPVRGKIRKFRKKGQDENTRCRAVAVENKVSANIGWLQGVFLKGLVSRYCNYCTIRREAGFRQSVVTWIVPNSGQSATAIHSGPRRAASRPAESEGHGFPRRRISAP